MNLYIFDVDGTLTETASGETFRKNAADWKWLPRRIEQCEALRAQGARVALATNQAGVAFPWSRFTEAEIRAEIEAVARAIGAEYVGICYTTPNPKALPNYHHPNDQRRKPGPGMILEALNLFSVSKEDALYVGDRPEDEQAAEAAGVHFMWAEDFFR